MYWSWHVSYTRRERLCDSWRLHEGKVRLIQAYHSFHLKHCHLDLITIFYNLYETFWLFSGHFFHCRSQSKFYLHKIFRNKYIELYCLLKEKKIISRAQKKQRESLKPLTSEEDHELYYLYPLDLLKGDKVSLLFCEGKMKRDKKLEEGRNE